MYCVELMEVRRKLVAVGSFLPSHGFQGGIQLISLGNKSPYLLRYLTGTKPDFSLC